MSFLRLDDALGWTGRYTAWNAPYNAERCRCYARQAAAEAAAIARFFRRAKEISIADLLDCGSLHCGLRIADCGVRISD